MENVLTSCEHVPDASEMTNWTFQFKKRLWGDMVNESMKWFYSDFLSEDVLLISDTNKIK